MPELIQHKMIYGLEDKPPAHLSMIVAFQHLLAVFSGIITAPLIIALGMGLSLEESQYFVSSSLLISGIATFIQIHRLGPLGSGLLSIQGTSFTFIGPLISAYYIFVDGHTSAQALGIIFGTSAVCAMIIFIFGSLIKKFQNIITGNVTGTVVILIGFSLVWGTLHNLWKDVNSGGINNTHPWIICFLTIIVFFITLYFSRYKNPIIRLFSVSIGLISGFIISLFFGMVPTEKLNGLDYFFLPEFARFPFGFDWSLFFVLLPVFIISSIESVGDLTATCALSGIKINSKKYWERVRGGILGDALNSFIATIFCAFPNTTFSQNNGVIRLTGVSSPYIGRFVAFMLCLLGLFPIVGGILVILPRPVLYGATILMFFMVIFSGISIVQSQSMMDKKSWWVVGTAVVLGWFIPLFIPLIVSWVNVFPENLIRLLSFPISTGAVIAIVIELIRKVFNQKINRAPSSVSEDTASRDTSKDASSCKATST